MPWRQRQQEGAPLARRQRHARQSAHCVCAYLHPPLLAAPLRCCSCNAAPTRRWQTSDNPRGEWRDRVSDDSVVLHYAYALPGDVAAKARRSCPGDEYLLAARSPLEADRAKVGVRKAHLVGCIVWWGAVSMCGAVRSMCWPTSHAPACLRPPVPPCSSRSAL